MNDDFEPDAFDKVVVAIFLAVAVMALFDALVGWGFAYFLGVAG